MANRPRVLNLNSTSRIERANRPSLVSEHWFSPYKEIRKKIISEHLSIVPKFELNISLFFVIPIEVSDSNIEYSLSHFYFRHGASESDSRSVETTVYTRATTLSLTPALAGEIVRDIIDIGASIDADQLENITQLAALRGRIKSPQQQEVEMLDRMGIAMSSMLNSGSGFDSDPGDSSPFPAGSTSRADEVVSMGQTVKGAGGVLAAAGGIAALGGAEPVAAVLGGVGGLLYLIGLGIETAGEAVGGTAKESEYPDVPNASAEEVGQFLALIAAEIGDRTLENLYKSIEIQRGGAVGAPEIDSGRTLFGVPLLDAHILALIRKTIEAGRGGHVTNPIDPSDETEVMDLSLVSRDPNWNPYAIEALAARTSNINALIDRMASLMIVE